jgi:NAD(P)-dependent dehydrogenase (short-subunit alcohol dehydrogenase family)
VAPEQDPASGRLRDRVAVVTGGAAGIGAGIAAELAREGAAVVIADVREEAAEETAGSLREAGAAALAVGCDVSREDDVRALMQTAADELGGLHAVVNNAGIGVYTSVTDATVEEFDRCLAVNLRGVFLGIKYAAPRLEAAGGGSIVNIASVHSTQNVGGTAPYAASKGGVAALTRAAAIDLAPARVRVNAICPGWIDTPLIRGIFEAAPDPEDERRAVERRQLLGRLGTPEEVGRAAVFLASDDASYITGSLMFVDAGMTAQLETWSD